MSKRKKNKSYRQRTLVIIIFIHNFINYLEDVDSSKGPAVILGEGEGEGRESGGLMLALFSVC